MLIYKYPLTANHIQYVNMPRGAKVLAVASQGSIPTIWAEVDPEAPMEIRSFCTCVTGGEAPGSAWKYIGTYQSGWFVGHLYEFDTRP
jgi:hypothetical protein